MRKLLTVAIPVCVFLGVSVATADTFSEGGKWVTTSEIMMGPGTNKTRLYVQFDTSSIQKEGAYATVNVRFWDPSKDAPLGGLPERMKYDCVKRQASPAPGGHWRTVHEEDMFMFKFVCEQKR